MSGRCSVVVRCLNEEAHLPRLLKALARQSVRADELIVVDSGSTDRSVEIAQRAGARVVRIAQQEFSFGRSLNLGVAAAGGEVVVIASAHVYPIEPTWLAALLAPFAEPEIALVYGQQRGDARTKFSEHQILRQWFPEESCADQRHPFCNNGNAAIRRSCWLQQRYNEELSGLEDIDWARRALERGWRLAYRHDAAVIHVHEETYAKIYQRYRREAIALQRVAPQQMRRRDAWSLGGQAIAWDVREARHRGVLRAVWWSIVRFRWAQYRGTYDGLRWHGPMTDQLRARLFYPEGYAAQAGGASTRPAASGPLVLAESDVK